MRCISPRCPDQSDATWHVAGEPWSGFCGRCRIKADFGVGLQSQQPIRWIRISGHFALIAADDPGSGVAAYFFGSDRDAKVSACVSVMESEYHSFTSEAVVRRLLLEGWPKVPAHDIASVAFHLRGFSAGPRAAGGELPAADRLGDEASRTAARPPTSWRRVVATSACLLMASTAVTVLGGAEVALVGSGVLVGAVLGVVYAIVSRLSNQDELRHKDPSRRRQARNWPWFVLFLAVMGGGAVGVYGYGPLSRLSSEWLQTSLAVGILFGSLSLAVYAVYDLSRKDSGGS